MTALQEWLLKVAQSEIYTAKGHLNFVLVAGIIAFAKGYHSIVKMALKSKYPMGQISKCLKPILNVWLFFGLFVLFMFTCGYFLYLLDVRKG